MKILAIRGENLASLAGRFEVDLALPPLGSAGLFAITGPTGAGKSTLLDAMCVALFDKTPRLEKTGGVKIGRADDDDSARLPSNDVRALLRRGVGAGYAEVDYLGRDGRRYRATWKLRRARDRANGAYQKQEMNLLDLGSGLSLGRTKTEVLEKIVETIGLSYDQFRRSALLAQGDFAAFLRANSDERASLLEQMTGTGLYSEISKKAHSTCSDAQKKYDTIKSECGSVLVLSPEDRAALEAEIVTLDDARKVAADEKTHVEGATRWFAMRASLRASVTRAHEEARSATAAHEDEAPRRARLAQVEAAALHRPVLVAADDAAAALERADEARRAREVAAGEATQLHDHAKTALALETEAFHVASSAREAARPALAAATRLDLIIETTEKRRLALFAAEQRAAGELATAGHALAVLQAALEETERLAVGREVWLEEHASSATLVNAWSRAEPALTRYAQASTDRKLAADARPACVAAQDQALSTHTKAKDAVAAAEKALRTAKDAWEAVDSEAKRAAVPAEMRAEGEQLVQRLQNAAKLAPIVEQVADQQKLATRAKRKAAGARAKVQAASEEEKALRDEGMSKKATLKEAERALQTARSTLDLADHRADLRDDEPCPLCGAHDHPYAQNDGPLASLITKAEARVTRLQEKCDQVKERRAACRADAEAAKTTAEEADQAEKEALEAIVKLQKRWKKETAALGVEAKEPDAAGQTVVEAAIHAAKERLRIIQTAEKRALALATTARGQQETRDGHQKSFEKATLGFTAAATCLSDAKQKLKNCEDRMAQAERDRDRAATDIAPAFTEREGWRAALDASPSRFEATCTAEVTTYRDKVGQQADDTRAISDLHAKLGVARATVGERGTVAGKCANETAEADVELTRVREERAAILSGKPTRDVQESLDARVKQADSERTDAQAAEHHHAQQAIAAATAGEAAATSLAERSAALTRTQAELTHALALAGIDLPTLRDRLAQPQDWIEGARATLTALDTALADARTVAGERTRACAEHEGKDAPSLTEDEARDRMAPVAEADRSAVESLAGARERRRTDDDARKAVQGKAAELEARRKDAEHWRKMDSLIGSSDGKKLRVFAQSLTLEALMSHANEHLDSFAPRYRIMRVPEQDLDLQIIDQDMGDEVRSVNSLSGGESFLVSLALALGLSSLAAHDVRVETLFIDEGFGTLDPETLDVALAALDALQSAGRKIGLISHVSGLAEQIGAQVQIRKRGGGRSDIVVEGNSPTGAAATEKARSLARARRKPSSPNEPTAG